jgi:hypothetical protein
MRTKSTFLFLSLILSVFMLAGCGPVYQTHYSYIPPHSWHGRRCINRCLTARTYCRGQCQSSDQVCQSNANMAAMPAYLAYVHRRNQEGKSAYLSVSDFADYSSCSNSCVFGYGLVSYQSLLKGLSKLIPNKKLLSDELNAHWEILAEPIQMVMRRYGITDAYERLKKITRGETISKKQLHDFIDTLTIPEAVKKELKLLKPENYLGIAVQLAKK